MTSRALHPNIFEQPVFMDFFNNLLMTTARRPAMKQPIFLLALLLVLTSGCIRFKTGFYPESYKADFQGWFKCYGSYKEMPKWDGTILKIATFDEDTRPGELLTIDIPFLAGVGIGPIGARVRILPFALGVGTIAYDPKPHDKAVKKDMPAKKEPEKEKTK
jgi:hypothetical protein